MNSTPKPRLRVLSKEDARQIHEAALEILRATGMQVHDRETVEMLKAAGCRQDAEGYVHFEAELVHEALSTVPLDMVLFDRNGEVAVDTAANLPCYCSGINCIDMLDHRSGELRPCVLTDIVDTARVVQALPNIHMVGSLGCPSDVPVTEEAMATVRAMAENSVKPLGFTGHDEVEARQIWAYLAELAGGWEALAEKPFALDLTGPTSPLTLGDEACRRLRQNARWRVPSVCYPGLIPGAGGPVTLAGALAQSAAEILAGIVVHQMEGPGAPVISGSAILPMDMRTGNLAYGSPDYSLVCLAGVDYFNDIGVPSWIGAGCSDAHRVDAQAAGEAGMNIMAAAFAGTAFVHNMGYLSSGKTGSLEMLVLCDELAAMAKRTLTGVTVNPDTLAVGVTERAAKTGSFLDDEHTLAHFRTELSVPGLFQRLDASTWGETGKKETGQRIRERLAAILGE